jgi:superfamily II DNA or RNA helicase
VLTASKNGDVFLANPERRAIEEQFQSGDIVAGLEPDEHVEIKRIVPFGSKFLLEGIGLSTRREIKRPLDEEQLSQLIKIRGSDYAYNGDAEAFLMGVEAHRIKIAYQFDPLFAVNSSVVDVLPHQVEAVYRYLLPLPRIRFLLADDTGAGKTIMTGLLIKELLFRGTISKILILTPGGLTRQWLDEMSEKFGLSFRLINRASFEADSGQFAQTNNGMYVSSIDYISRHEVCLNAAKETQWDMIVVDEAHKLSAYEYGSKVERSDRYQAVEALAPRTDHLMFLTATPHRGRKDTFRRLLMLLDEDLFQKDELVTRRIHEAVSQFNIRENHIEAEEAINKARNRFFLRRLKEEIVDWNEEDLFKPRHTKTTQYELTLEELDLYNSVTQYVRSRRKEAKAKRNRNVELTLMVMQRRLASSIFAITRTLENRLKAIDEVLEILRDPLSSKSDRKRFLLKELEDIPENISEYEDLDEIQREEVDKRIFRQVLSDNPAEVEREREQVADLLAKARALKNHPEAKFAELLRVLDTSDVIRKEDEKLVIFTEHKDTLINLEERLIDKGYTVTTIDGSMDVEKRKEAQRKFRSKQTKIMVATDAAGEGINLQFCRYLINWDIPWNPNRLEQRMGRIHRYGQKDDVWVYNMVALNTREGSVLNKVLTKLDTMREQMGTDRVYDVIDELLEKVPLAELIEKSVDTEDEHKANDEVDANLPDDRLLKQSAEDLINLQRKKSLASHLNLKLARELWDKSDEQRLQPEFIRRFFLKAYRLAGGSVREDQQYPVYHIGKTPSALLEVARQKRLPLPAKYEYPFVFDKELVSVASRIQVPENTKLLGPGQPLFDALIEWTIRRAREAFTRGALIVDPNIAKPQRIWLLRSSIEDERREEKIRLAHQELNLILLDHLGLRKTSAGKLLDFTTPDSPVEMPEVPNEADEVIQMWTYENVTENRKDRVVKERAEECNLRREYLENTFTELIMDLQEKLNDLQQAQLLGDDDPEERQKLEQRIRQLKERKTLRLQELELMMRLNANLPEILTSALVIPPPVVTIEETASPRKGVPMRRDDEVEQIAMDVVMRYERSRGWNPVDVSKDGDHYDIRSQSPSGGKRFIEVKGRAQTGDVMISDPEMNKLRQLGERAYLYIVTYCKSEQPKLRIIQNPMSQLNPQMLYKQVQYLINQKEWQQRGEAIDDLPASD